MQQIPAGFHAVPVPDLVGFHHVTGSSLYRGFALAVGKLGIEDILDIHRRFDLLGNDRFKVNGHALAQRHAPDLRAHLAVLVVGDHKDGTISIVPELEIQIRPVHRCILADVHIGARPGMRAAAHNFQISPCHGIEQRR